MNKNNLLTGDIRDIFYKFLIPSVAGMLGTAIYFLGDTIIIGQALGAEGLAGLNIVLPIFRLVNAVALIFGIGGATCLSIARGQEAEEKANQIFNISLILSSIVGVVLVLVRIFFLEELINLLGATEFTYGQVESYLSIYLYFNVFTILNSVMCIFVRNDGSPNLVMISMVVSSFLNIILDYIFVYPMDLGIWGAALATGISPIVGLIILSRHFFKGRNNLYFKVPDCNLRDMNWIVRNGFPSFILEFSVGIVIYLFNMTLLNIEGDLGVSAYGIIVNLSLFVSAIFNGVGQAIQPIVSMNYGAGNEERVDQAGRLGIRTSFILGLIFFGLGLFFPVTLAKSFTSERGQLIDLTVRAIQLYFIAFIFMGVNISVISYIQSKEEIKASIMISLLRGSLLIVVFLLFLPRVFGLDGVWLTVPITEIVTMIIYLFLLKDIRSLVININR